MRIEHLLTLVLVSAVNDAATAKSVANGEISDSINNSKFGCGKRFFQQNFGLERGGIVGGQDAVRGAYPWQVNIRMYQEKDGQGRDVKNYRMICGGTIIDNRHILTAAHCVNDFMNDNPQLYWVVAGEQSLKEHGWTEQWLRIAGAYKHSDFNLQKIDNDVALIKTEKPIRFGVFVQPACLPHPLMSKLFYKPGNQVILSGWGRQERMKKPDILQASAVNIVDHQYCVFQFASQNRTVTGNEFCAGINGKVSSCYGDSGGPVVYKHKKRFHVIGIVSWGHRDCLKEGFPTVYVKVTEYLDWIDMAKAMLDLLAP